MHHDHLPGEETVEPQGKLNDARIGPTGEKSPAGRFSLSVGKRVVKRCLTRKRDLDLCLK